MTSSKMKNLLLLGIFLSIFQLSLSDIPEFCKEPNDPGHGTIFAFSMYYDPKSDQCNPFFYQGEGGNANRFTSERHCMSNCSPNAESVYPRVATKACHLKKENGGCTGTFLRYYYDSVHDKCKKFIWTGCRGNGNRFFDYNSCNATCAGVHVDGEEMEEDEPDTPIAIICGVLLALVVVAVIGTVTFLVVKSKKKKGKKKDKVKSDAPQAEAPLQEGGIEMT
ncbi:kunitz-type U19-barytoxin-Tl1a [Oryzias latipes]|uniref:Si:dkeyp-73b11.8 n=1 Tax=Oryzias latipes TaxID=8090 RepID=A0A3B3HW62_ORYLA|nr:kunitz-type U19-barytoxin-Tl1a [Oryzias latipes]